MAWTESHTVLIRHRKTVSMALQLKIKPVYVVGHLTVFWHSVLEQAEDGDISKWSPGFIASAACWEGSPDAFFSALTDNGFLDTGIVHDWLDYAGRYLESKYRVSKPDLMAKIREKHGRSKATNKAKTDIRQSKNSPPNLPNLPNLNPDKITKPTKPKEDLFDFDTLWDIYPNKDGKKSAEAHFKASVKTTQDYADIQKAVTNYLKSEKVKKGFIKNGSTFFNNWRDWIDYNEPVKSSTAGAAAPITGKYDGKGIIV